MLQDIFRFIFSWYEVYQTEQQPVWTFDVNSSLYEHFKIAPSSFYHMEKSICYVFVYFTLKIFKYVFFLLYQSCLQVRINKLNKL